MKSLKLSFDFSDTPELVEFLRLEAARSRRTQKGIIVDALKAYFGDKLETAGLYSSAEKALQDWVNEADSIYDTL